MSIDVNALQKDACIEKLIVVMQQHWRVVHWRKSNCRTSGLQNNHTTEIWLAGTDYNANQLHAGHWQFTAESANEINSKSVYICQSYKQQHTGTLSLTPWLDAVAWATGTASGLEKLLKYYPQSLSFFMGIQSEVPPENEAVGITITETDNLKCQFLQ